MGFRELHYRWEWTLRAGPRALWPFVADTNRFNRDTGVPSVEPVPTDGAPLRNARRRLRLFRLGLPVEWEEDPFEWSGRIGSASSAATSAAPSPSCACSPS